MLRLWSILALALLVAGGIVAALALHTGLLLGYVVSCMAFSIAAGVVTLLRRAFWNPFAEARGRRLAQEAKERAIREGLYPDE